MMTEVQRGDTVAAYPITGAHNKPTRATTRAGLSVIEGEKLGTALYPASVCFTTKDALTLG